MALKCWVALRVTVSVPYFLIIGFGKGVTPQLRRLYLSILFESFGSENTIETFVAFDHGLNKELNRTFSLKSVMKGVTLITALNL